MNENFTLTHDLKDFNNFCEKFKEGIRDEIANNLNGYIDETDTKAMAIAWNLFLSMQRVINDQNKEINRLRCEINEIRNTLESK